MSKRNRDKRNRSKSDSNRTPISGHTRQGSELLPPFAQLGKVAFSSWMNDRLPEMIWAAIIGTALPRDDALCHFRRILTFIAEHKQRGLFHDITLTGIAKLDASFRVELITFIAEPSEIGQALATLRLFEALPALDVWDKCLPPVQPAVDLLMSAVGATLWHQSQLATDCRWVRVMAQVMSGRFQIPPDTAKEWFGYPNDGDQRKVRPSIRAAEMIHDPSEQVDHTWPRSFWDEAWRRTPCLGLIKQPKSPFVGVVVTRQRISEINQLIMAHWLATHRTTAIDAKHDGVFGMAFYALRILEELLLVGIGSTILGRLGLRTILETRINLGYLMAKNDDSLWKKWRTYGAGQAKLNALKFDDNIDPPKHIDIQSIEQIAGEDIWEEFLAINLASWSGLDLRRLSEQSRLKSVYDQHYSWTSGYAHGMWGPIRESCFQTCGNPLHRFHRYPEQRLLPDTVDDSASLVDAILIDLDKAFPSFPHRVLPDATASS